MKESNAIYFLDTNIFIRVFVREDARSFEECTTLLNGIRNGKVNAATSTLVLAEIAWVLGSFYKYPKERVIEAIDSILSMKNLAIQDGYDNRIALILFEKHSVKFVDTLLAAHHLVLQGRAVLTSYDKDFDRLPCQRVSPEKVTFDR
jgi:predicted nucleic acid-binding protein